MKNTHKLLTALVISLTLTGIASAGWFDGGGTQSKDGLSGEVDTSNVEVGSTFWTEMGATEANHQNLVKSEPIPKMEDSLERENLIRRYKTLNDQNEVFHVYLLSYGKVVAYYTAQGKVSSVNSKLTQPEQIVKDGDGSYQGEQNDHVVSSPQLDGSYGTNGDGKFFFDTSGAYIETNMNYIVSQRPLNIRTPPVIETSVEQTTK